MQTKTISLYFIPCPHIQSLIFSKEILYNSYKKHMYNQSFYANMCNYKHICK